MGMGIGMGMGMLGRPGRVAPLDLTGGDLGALVRRGSRRIERSRRSHAERWELGSEERWELDPEAGRLRWVFGDHLAEAPVQVIGTHQTRAARWRWAWADKIVPPAMGADARTVRQWATEHEQPGLLPGELRADEQQADRLASLAVELAGATGLFRAASGRSQVYLTFGEVTVTPTLEG